MTDLAFLGLGRMGVPMAARLLDAGHTVTVWNRTPQKARALTDRGARLAGSPAEAAAGVEGAITMLAGPDALRSVLFGPDGLVAALPPGSTLIEMSTVGPDVVREVAARLPEGARMMDVPVQGSVPQATEGSLRLWAGGEAADLDRWHEVLDVLGTPLHVGGLGAGAALKLVMNSTLGSTTAVLGEALALGEALGLDLTVLLDALSDSPVGSQASSKRASLESGRYPPRFRLALARKDMSLVTEAAEARGVDMPVARAAREWFVRADQAGLGDLDYSAVMAHERGTPAAPDG